VLPGGRGDTEPESVITRRGRPSDRPQRFVVSTLAVRMIVLAWGIAVIAALLDAFGGDLQHLPFVTAAGMTGLLVAAVWVITHDGVPDWRGDTTAPARRHDDEDAASDLLTNLPTFAFFQRRLDEEFGRGRRMGKPLAVVLIDVNNLTAVNKEYGVKAGDEVLRHVASAVDGTRRYNDVVARLGDDEYGVLLLDCGEEGIKAFVDRLEERLSRESALAEVNNRMISLWAGVCTGSAIAEPRMNSAEDVLRGAMTSLNDAKQDRERRRRMWLSA
jgi:diguanylate cyclase (GGDEF)-like protein